MTRWPGIIEAYRDRLPVTDKTPVVTLNEGNTPLVDAPRLSDTVRARVTDLAVGRRAAERIVAGTARANDPCSHAPRLVQTAGGVLRGKSLVVVFVARENDLGTRVVERLEQWPDLGSRAIFVA